jgi:general secretion pathway protein F
MPVFHYKAANTKGDVLEGDMQALSKNAVFEHLQQLGHMPILAEEIRAGQARRGLVDSLFARRRMISQNEVGILTRELATLLRAGMPLERALDILIELADQPRLKETLTDVRNGVRGGSSLSAAMEAQKGGFTHFYTNMVQAGEAGGALDVMLVRLAEFMEESSRLKETVKSALIYPAVLVTVAGLSIIILLTFVVPQFTVLFEEAGRTLPLPTRILVAMGTVLQHYWWVLLLLAGGLAYYLRRMLEDPGRHYRWDRRLLKLPLVGDLIAKLEVTRFARTLGMLLTNGIPLLQALTIVKQTAMNRVMAEAIEMVTGSVKEGQGLSGPLMRVGRFPRLAVHMVRVGEETGHLAEMLQQVAETYEREVKTAIQRMLALLEPTLILGMGIVIAGIIMSILLAILSINQLAF